jgi:hypothetical protein
MKGSVLCSVGGCHETVIGQCIGYSEPCGSYFCEEHTKGGLCLSCATLKSIDQIMSVYSKNARKIDSFMKKALTTLAVLLIACFIIVLMTNSFGVFGLIIGIIISLGISIMALRKYKSDAMKKIKEIESEHPRFSEFYMANRNKQPIQMSEIAEIITVTAMYTQFFKEE